MNFDELREKYFEYATQNTDSRKYLSIYFVIILQSHYAAGRFHQVLNNFAVIECANINHAQL